MSFFLDQSSAPGILGCLVGGERLGGIFGIVLVIFDHDGAFTVGAAVPRVLSELGAAWAHQVATHHALTWVYPLFCCIGLDQPSTTCILGCLVGGERFGGIFGIVLVVLDHDGAFTVGAAVPRVLSQLGATRTHQVATHHALARVHPMSFFLDQSSAPGILGCLVGGERLGGIFGIVL